MVDRNLMCNSCLEKFLETHFVDEHRIVRLSENDADFPEYTCAGPGRKTNSFVA